MDNRVHDKKAENYIMTLGEVADYLRLAEKTVLRMVHNGKIPCAKVASQWRFMRALIDEWLMSQMKGTPQNDLARLIESKSDIVPLSRLIREDFIILDVKPGSKEEVLSQLIQPFINKGILKDSKRFLEKLMYREELSSPAIGRGIASPHIRDPRENSQGGPVLCVGICKKGTDFEALDGKKTHLFFLLYTDNEVVHLRVLAKLIGILRNDESVSQLMAAISKEENIKYILKEDQERLFSA